MEASDRLPFNHENSKSSPLDFNTCFIISIIHCLNHTGCLRDGDLDGGEDSDLARSRCVPLSNTPPFSDFR